MAAEADLLHRIDLLGGLEDKMLLRVERLLLLNPSTINQRLRQLVGGPSGSLGCRANDLGWSVSWNSILKDKTRHCVKLEARVVGQGGSKRFDSTIFGDLI